MLSTLGLTKQDPNAMDLPTSPPSWSAFPAESTTAPTLTYYTSTEDLNSKVMYFVGGSLAASGVIRAGALDQVNLAGNLAGAVDVSGPIDTITVGGSLAGSGSVDATSLGALKIGGNLAGAVDATGTIDEISVAGATPGTIVANHIGVVSAGAATGPTLLDVVEAGVTREIQVTPVAAGKTSIPALRFAYVYDSNGPGAPQVALRVVNPTGVRFDLGLDASSGASFNLAALDGVGHSALRNLAIDGALLGRVSPADATKIGLSPNARGGVNLPDDRLGVIAVSGDIPVGSVHAAAVQGLAFGSLSGPRGRLLAASQARPKIAASILRPGTRLVQAEDTFRVPVFAHQPVTLFLDAGPKGFVRAVQLSQSARDGEPNLATVVPVDDSFGPSSSRSFSCQATSSAASGAGNLIGANQGDGIQVGGTNTGSSGTLIEGNLIGLDLSGRKTAQHPERHRRDRHCQQYHHRRHQFRRQQRQQHYFRQ
jgi:hypothetical protein